MPIACSPGNSWSLSAGRNSSVSGRRRLPPPPSLPLLLPGLRGLLIGAVGLGCRRSLKSRPSRSASRAA